MVAGKKGKQAGGKSGKKGAATAATATPFDCSVCPTPTKAPKTKKGKTKKDRAKTKKSALESSRGKVVAGSATTLMMLMAVSGMVVAAAMSYRRSRAQERDGFIAIPEGKTATADSQLDPLELDRLLGAHAEPC